MNTGGVLALDLSSTVGFCYGTPGVTFPLFGEWALAKGDLGALLASFENELEDTITIHRPALVMVEAPLPPKATRNNGAISVRQQLSLAGAAQATAWRHDITCREQAASTIRAEVLGTSRFPNGDPKTAIMDYCRAQGWDVPGHHAGDACVTWVYTCRHLPMSMRPQAAV